MLFRLVYILSAFVPLCSGSISLHVYHPYVLLHYHHIALARRISECPIQSPTNVIVVCRKQPQP